MPIAPPHSPRCARLSRLRDEVTTWESLQSRLQELHELAEMLETAPDADLEAEIVSALAEIDKELERPALQAAAERRT